LQSNYWWDIDPESPTTNIDAGGDDKGTGYITFYFSKPVENPVLHIDRLGGDWHVNDDYIITNSALWTLVNSNLTLTRLSGNNQFQVIGKSLRRTPDQVFSSITPEATWNPNSAAAGTVRINGITDSVTFRWTGTGIESVGHDGIELIWDLTDHGAAPNIIANITPNQTRSGESIYLNAIANNYTTSMRANILGTIHNLVKNGEHWTLNYNIPLASDGLKTITLSATDIFGNIGYKNLNFTVDNTKPIINANITPNLTKSKNNIIIKALTDPDTTNLTANILGTTYNLIKTNNEWILEYNIPHIPDGIISVFLIAIDHVANQGETQISFTVDNTPPPLNGEISPNLVRFNKTIDINIHTNQDAQNVVATIFGVDYNLVKISNEFWNLQNNIPDIVDGLYFMTVKATDLTNNSNNLTLNFTVDNTAPIINANITPNITKSENNIIIKALTDPDTTNLTANILGTTYNLIKTNNEWILEYNIPEISDGIVQVFLTATDLAGNQGQTQANFTVDNTLPQIISSITPKLVKTGQIITLKVITDPGVTNLAADINSNIFNLTSNDNGTWILNYQVPKIPDGFQNMILKAIDSVGNNGTSYSGFTVDNTAPTIKGYLKPIITKIGDIITIKATADPDTQSLTAKIMGNTYQMTKKGDQWNLQYRISEYEGSYNIQLTALDFLNNQGNSTLNFTVKHVANSLNNNNNNNIISFIELNFNPKNTINSNIILKPPISNPKTKNINDFSIYGPLAPYLTGNGNPLSGLFKYNEAAWSYNNKGSIYGPFASILNNPFNPLNFQFYAFDKFIQAGQKAWKSGNIWDFFNSQFYHIYGYSNLNNTTGGQNIKGILDLLTGVDGNGNLSLGNFLLLLISIVPLSRAGIAVTKFLGKIRTLIKIWGRLENPLTKILKKLNISARNPIEAFLGLTSKIGSILDPGAGLIPAFLETVAGLTGRKTLLKIVQNPFYQRLMRYDTIRSVVTVFNPNNWNLNHLNNKWKTTIKSGKSIVKWTSSTIINSSKKIINKTADKTKKLVNKVVKTVKKIVPVLKKVFKTLKKAVKKVYKSAKKAVKKVYKTVKKTVKKAVRSFTKTVNKVVKSVKKTVNRTIKAIKSFFHW
jgi:catabolite regulation protein CreA